MADTLELRRLRSYVKNAEQNCLKTCLLCRHEKLIHHGGRVQCDLRPNNGKPVWRVDVPYTKELMRRARLCEMFDGEV